MRRPAPLLVWVAGALLFRIAAAEAVQTITVNSDADSGGICPGPTCTLRQAIATALPGDTIDFAASITTITLTSAELLINKDLTIDGPGASLLTIKRSADSGTPAFRIFNIFAGDVAFHGLTIANGRTAAASKHGGGIYNSSGTLNVAECVISGNGTYIDQYGTDARGGGIFNPDGGTVNIILSTVSANTANQDGGGIYNSSGGTVNIRTSTISENRAESAEEFNKGGGIYNSSGGTVNVSSSTISGNVAFGGAGVAASSQASGIYNDGTLTITSCTVADNWRSGIANHGSGTVYARNSIIARNHVDGAGYPPDFYGTLTSQGYNLIGDTHACCTGITGDTTGNQLNVDPKLGPLQDNGGPTFTHALLFGSPAIDAGESSGSHVDQRGFVRPIDAPDIPNATGGDGSDMGAFEHQSPMSATPTPTPTATPTSTPTATPTSTATATATPTATPTSTPTATPTVTPAKALNISTRSRVQTGDNVMIGGFILTGNASTKVIVRAIGPSLEPELTDVLADPILELHGPNGSLIASNDNWRDNPDQALLIQASGIPPEKDLESAIVATLAPAGYTAIVSGKSGGTGLGLIEVYDLDGNADSALANISTRALVGTGNNVLIGGFILGGDDGNPTIIIRALGPSLSGRGVANPLADPTLELRDGNGMLLAFDNNWKDNSAQASQIVAAGLQPPKDPEAAIAATLPPGTYTAIVGGRNAGTGVGLIEVYTLR